MAVMICFDREFPESARILMLKGGGDRPGPPMPAPWRSTAFRLSGRGRMRIRWRSPPAIIPRDIRTATAGSTVFDGIAWLDGEPGSRDMCILEAPGEEGIYLAEINLDQLREYRRKEVMGSPYRRPETYGPLLGG